MIWKEICAQRVVIGELEVEIKPFHVGRRKLRANVAEIMFTKKKSSVSGLVKGTWRRRGMCREEIHGFLEIEMGMKLAVVVRAVRIGRVNRVGKKVKAAKVMVGVGSRSEPE